MPSRKKINFEKVMAALNTTCPTCQAVIEPAQIRRLNFEEIQCDAIFEPRKKTGMICPHCPSRNRNRDCSRARSDFYVAQGLREMRQGVPDSGWGSDDGRSVPAQGRSL